MTNLKDFSRCPVRDACSIDMALLHCGHLDVTPERMLAEMIREGLRDYRR